MPQRTRRGLLSYRKTDPIPFWAVVTSGVGVLAIVGGLVAVGALQEWFASVYEWAAGLDANQLRASIEGLGPLAPLASVGLMIVHTFVPFPLEILAIANGLVFGAWGGIAITWFSMVLSAWIGYATARFAGSLVHRLTSADRLRRMQEWVERRSTWELVAIRFIPVISFSVLNLALGLLRVPFWRFTWTTALGIIPIVVISVVSGHLLTLGPWAWAGIAALLLALVGWELYRKFRKG